MAGTELPRVNYRGGPDEDPDTNPTCYRGGPDEDPDTNLTWKEAELLGALGACDMIQDQQGRWWLCDGGHDHKDCGYNTFQQVDQDGEPVREDGYAVYMDFIALADIATFDLDYLRSFGNL